MQTTIAKKALAWLLITACLLGAGITQAYAATIGGTEYSHPVDVQNSTVWYTDNGDSRQIGGDAHTYNLIRRYEGDQSASNFYPGRGGKLRVSGAALNQNLWRKNKDTSAWQSHATDYSWLAKNGAGSTLSNALSGRVYLSDKEFNSKNKAFAIVGKVGASPSGKQYNINTDVFKLRSPLLQLTPVYQETTGKAGFWLARNTLSVQYQGIGDADCKQIPVTIKGTNVPSAQNTGNFAAASKGSVQRTMRYGGSLDGSANVNPSSAQEQVYNYLGCDTDTSSRTLKFKDLSYGNWSAQIANNTGKDYTLQVSYKTAKGSIYKQYTAGAGDGYDNQTLTRTIDFPRGTTLTLPAAMLYSGGYINYTLKLIPKAPNQVTVNMIGIDNSDRGGIISYLDRKLDNGSYDTPWFYDNSKSWSNQGAGTYGIGITSMASYAYDVQVTVDYKASKNDSLHTISKTYHLDPMTVNTSVPSRFTAPKVHMSDGGMVSYTITFYRDVSSRRVQINLLGLTDDDYDDTLSLDDQSQWAVKKADTVNGAYSKIPISAWPSGGGIGIDIPNGGDSDYYQTAFAVANAKNYKLSSIRCTVIDNASGRVIRSYDVADYPSGTMLAALTQLPNNLNGDGKKLALNGTAQNGVQIAPGQTAVYDIVLKQQNLFRGNISAYLHMDTAMKTDNSDGLQVALCRPDMATDYDPDGVVATALFRGGKVDFGTQPTGKKYTIKFLDYDKVGYAVTPTADNSPSINSLGATGWVAHFYTKCAPITVAIGGGAPSAKKAGINIQVATLDEDSQTFIRVADITTDSSGKATYQPSEFDTQYYFIPQTTPEHCYYPLSKVGAERYTGAAQTVTLPLEQLEPITAVITKADDVEVALSGQEIDVYAGAVTNADGVENGGQPEYDYQKLTTITTDASGKAAYIPDRPGMALRFIPQPPSDKVIVTPSMAELFYTGTAQTVQFRLTNPKSARQTVIRFEDTKGRGIPGVTGTLVSEADSTGYAVSTNKDGDCLAYGLKPGNYVFKQDVVPKGSHPVHAKNFILSTSAGTSLILADKDITEYSDMTVQIAADAMLNIIKNPLQHVVYTLDRDGTDDVDISFHQPNAAYKKGTQVVSTFVLRNNTSAAYTPDTPLKVNAKFVYKQGGQEKYVYLGDKANVILPPDGSQIVYFKWTVPAGADAGTGQLRASVSLADGSPIQGNTLVTADVQVIDKTVFETPDTKFDTQSGKYYSYSTPQKDKDYKNYTTWQEWVWANNNYVKQSYNFKLRTQELTIYPDETNPSSTYGPVAGYTMRSGYAIKLRYIPKYVDNAPDDGLTTVQDVQAYFPEFYYAQGSAKQRTLELSGGQWKFRVNPFSTFKPGEKGDGRKHFTPMWFPDKPYQVQILATDCWTPVGMLSYLDNTNKINIQGSLYDDYYVSSGGSSVGDVEIKPGS